METTVTMIKNTLLFLFPCSSGSSFSRLLFSVFYVYFMIPGPIARLVSGLDGLGC